MILSRRAWESRVIGAMGKVMTFMSSKLRRCAAALMAAFALVVAATPATAQQGDLDACKPGLTEITPAARRLTNLQAMQDCYVALFEGGNLTRALTIAQNMEVAIRAQVGTKDSRYAAALVNIAQACDALYDAFDEAEALYKWALTFRLQSPGPD